MKNQIMIAMVAVGLMAGCATREYRVASMRELPLPVQQTIREQAPAGDIAHVVKNDHGARAVYSVSFHDPTANPPLVVASDGTLLSSGRAMVMQEKQPVIINEIAGAETLHAPTEMRVDDLPLPVQNAIRAQVPDAKVVNVNKQVKTGVVYDVQVVEPAAIHKMHIADDGTILSGD